MQILRKEFIYADMAPTPECHASTILKVDERFIAAWFGGEREGTDDVAIWCSVCENGVWSTPKAVSKEEGLPHWNPVLFRMDENTVRLFYKVGKQIPYWKTMFVDSTDGGSTWGAPCEVVEGDTSGGRGPVKNKAIRLSSGRLLAPASTEQGVWRPFIDVYENGKWEKKWMPVKGENAENVNLIQPTLWEYPDGCIHALMRTNQSCIYRSDSEDYGETWSAVYPTDMPNNNSGIDCVLAGDGCVYLVCNPISSAWGVRTPLSLFVSVDNGVHFEKVIDLENEEGEYSYPAIICEGKHLYITYTWKRKRVRFVELEIK